jgi:hypothetical protein
MPSWQCFRIMDGMNFAFQLSRGVLFGIALVLGSFGIFFASAGAVWERPSQPTRSFVWGARWPSCWLARERMRADRVRGQHSFVFSTTADLPSTNQDSEGQAGRRSALATSSAFERRQ